MRQFLALGAAAAALSLTASSFAGLIVTGDMTEIIPPESVAQNALESNDNIYIFQESVSTLRESLGVNILDPGLYDQRSDLVDGSIPAGLEVFSYFVHADRIDDGSGASVLSGTVTFPNRVLGIIVLTEGLFNSDAALGNPGTLYATGVPEDLFRGLEFIQQAPINLSQDRFTVSVNTAVLSARDQIRIVTEVPEPATLVGLTLAGLLALRRR